MYSKFSKKFENFSFFKRPNSVSMELENIELKKQIEVLKNLNRKLETKHVSRSKPVPKSEILGKPVEKISLSELSETKVDEFVEKILDDSDINIGYFPDYIERKIYKNVFKILVNLLDELVDTTSIGLLGHQIKLDMTPN